MNITSDFDAGKYPEAPSYKHEGFRLSGQCHVLIRKGLGKLCVQLSIGLHAYGSGRVYSRTLRGRQPRTLTQIPEENWPGNADRGTRLVNGEFVSYQSITPMISL